MAKTDSLQVSEIFFSIQGESTFAGLPCVFIRLSGCNLRCSYCDTQYAIEEAGHTFAVDDILIRIEDFPNSVVEITGGEPLLQQGVFPLIDRLLACGKTILVETNGSLDIAAIPVEVTVIMDIKCPGSGTSSLFHGNIETIRNRASRRTGATEIKFVLTGPADYLWAKEMVQKYELIDLAPVLFSPAASLYNAADLAAAILKDGLPVRLQIQLQRILWPKSHRGV